MSMSLQTMAPQVPPPYLPFATFLSGVQNLRDQGLPDPVDRTAWRTKSGADQSSLMSAFKFLGLINEDGRTQDALRALEAVDGGSEDEKRVLLDVLQARYPAVFALDLKTATPGQLNEAFRSFGDFSTLSRAVRFFLKAASYCGVAMSPRLATDLRERRGRSGSKGSNENGTTRRRRKSRTPEAPPPPPPPPAARTVSGDAMKTVTLSDVGGTLTLAATFNTFLLEGEERNLVFKMLDLMSELEKMQKEKP